MFTTILVSLLLPQYIAGALDEVDWLRNKLERLETSISAMARTAGSAPSEGGAAGNGPQASGQPGQPKEYRYDKSVLASFTVDMVAYDLANHA